MKRVFVIAVELKSASSYLFICWKLEYVVRSWTSREWSVFQLWTIWNWEHRYIVCTLKQIYRYRYHSVAIGTLFMLVYYVFKPICTHRVTSGSMCLWSHFVLELYLFFFMITIIKVLSHLREGDETLKEIGYKSLLLWPKQTRDIYLFVCPSEHWLSFLLFHAVHCLCGQIL